MRFSPKAYTKLSYYKISKLWSCGRNNYGQLGLGDTIDRNYPTFIENNNMNNIKQLAGGSSHSFALDEDGNLWAWGRNGFGQLGLGFASTRELTPIKVNISNIKQIIQTFGNFSVVLKNDGTVWTWGSNHYGQLGDGTKVDKYYPIMVSGLTNIIKVAEILKRADSMTVLGTELT